MLKAVNSDLIGGALGLGLAVTFWFAREDNWSFWSAVFPNVVIIIIGVLSVILLLKSSFAPAMLPVFQEGSRSKMLVTAIILLSWSYAFSRLGTLTSSFIGFTILTLYLTHGESRLGPRQLAVTAFVIVAELAVFYLLFTRVLHVQLPRGILF